LNLSADYRTVLAVFDTPLKRTREPFAGSGSLHKEYFRVGPLNYTLQIRRKSAAYGSGNHYSVVFEFKDLTIPNGETEAQVLSKLTGKSLSNLEASNLHFDMMRESTGVLGVKVGFQVLSSVIQILREYLKGRDWDCLSFTAYEESRVDLYRALIKRFFPGYYVDETLDGPVVAFNVCSPDYDE
jgi:hypothetical protein